jgi:hypothetical protein
LCPSCSLALQQPACRRSPLEASHAPRRNSCCAACPASRMPTSRRHKTRQPLWQRPPPSCSTSRQLGSCQPGSTFRATWASTAPHGRHAAACSACASPCQAVTPWAPAPAASPPAWQPSPRCKS